MNPLLAQFIPEARDLIDRAASGILTLESRPGDGDVINDVFRAVHTLKGSSGLFDVAPLTRLVHAAEDLLEEARNGGMELNSDIVDGLLVSLDVLTRWIDALERREQLPGDAEAESGERAAALRGWLKPRSRAEIAAASAVPERRAPAWLEAISEAERLQAFRAARGGALTAWSFDPEEDCFFRGDDPLGMVRHCPGLTALRIVPNRLLGALDTIDPLQCWLSLRGLSSSAPEAVRDHFRYVEDRVEVVEISAADLALPSGGRAEGPVFADFAALARRQLALGDAEALARSVAALIGMTAPSSRQASALRWLTAYLETSGVARAAELARLIEAIDGGVGAPALAFARPPQDLAPQDLAPQDLAPPDIAVRLAREQIDNLAVEAFADVAVGRFEAVARTLRAVFAALGRDPAALTPALAAFRERRDAAPLRALVDSLGHATDRVSSSQALHAAATPAAATPAPDVAPPRPKPETVAASEGAGLPKVLRVDQGKIDTIMNLAAELIVAKNGLAYLADRAEREYGVRALSREIKDAYAVFDRLAQELQLGVMSVRMTPINQVLQRFPRLVRDVARALGKKVELVIEGEDTEADKNVLESLADPLIHIVRNSLDHGVEGPEERRAAGKPEHGTVKIAARNQSDFVVIEVSDDGRGVDVARVREKAVTLGIITAERAEAMSEAEAANLVFLPGFSTKDEVSDLSGRGVGMDVVRSTVVKAGGDVTLRNSQGQGATVIIRLPLTMAVTRIVTVDCGGRLFGIPMDMIAETVKLAEGDIRHVNNAEAFVLREAIVPLVRLGERLGLSDGETREGDAAVMVVSLGGELVGLVVDGFRERMETVVKPLQGILEGAAGFSGTALLGDGRVLLILDLHELI
jgi:two-component system chemotaxis sensor kinase CheA